MKGPILILTALMFIGCSPRHNAPDPTERVLFASAPPLAHIAEVITSGNDAVKIATLVADGQSPHSYEPTAKQLAKLSEASMLITLGLPFEEALVKKIRAQQPNLIIVEADAGIEKRAMPHEHGAHCDHDHGERDPHVWLDLPNLLTISETIRAALTAADPAHAALYQQNFDTHAQRISARHDQLTEQLEASAGTRFYVYHPSFGYFADRYGLAQVPIELDGKSPSPRQLADLIEQAQVDGVKVIFVQKRFPSDSAQAVARAIGGEVVRVDPLDKDVVATLGRIADSIARTVEP